MISEKFKAFDAMIFDLDGTLWDSTERVVEAWAEVLKGYKEVKIEITKELLEGIFGTQHNLIGKKLFPDVDESLVDEMMHKCYTEENNLIRKNGGYLYDNLEEVLGKLSETIPLYIVSNCQEGYIEAFLEFHKLGKYFKDFECSGNTGMSKDKNIKLIMERNNLISPAYVGDTMGDYTAAKANNLPFIFAKYGFGTVETPDYIIDEFKDLIK